MKRQPILPKTDKSWNEDSNAYRKALHEDLYPKNQAWNPPKGGFTSTAVDAEYVRMARLWVFSIMITGPSVGNAGAYIDLPFEVSQYSVFSVAIGEAMTAATIDKGSSRLYLPSWASTARVIISGVAVS